MTLATHTIIGLGLASLVAPGPWQPVAVFGLALAGHYVSDMIPHWDYTPAFLLRDPEDKMNHRMTGGKKLFGGMLVVGAEFLLGIIIGGILFYDPIRMTAMTAVVGIIGSVLPDLLQPFYYVFRRNPFTSIQKFHNFFHAGRRIDDPLVGIASQVFLVAIFSGLVSTLLS